MDLDQRLTDHFQLRELVASDTARAHGLLNEPTPAALANLRALAFNVLEPLRLIVGRPVTINSGYRAPAVNAAVGGSSSSQHMAGQAADLEVPGIPTAHLAVIVAHLIPRFDQLILEHYKPSDPSSGWVHVSYDMGRARRSILTIARGAKPRPGLVFISGV